MSHKLREGQFQSAGQTVNYTDADTLALASDLYQLVEHDYHGSPAIDATRLEEIIKHLHAGLPLNDVEWNVLRDIRERLLTQLEEWRASGRDGQDPAIPAGSGRIEEAMATLPPSLSARIRENPVRVQEGSPAPPPHLRMSPPHSEQVELQSDKPVRECGTCRMFDEGRCWGYGNMRVDDDWLCDSWELDPDWRAQNAAWDTIMEAARNTDSDTLAALRRMREGG